MKHFTRTLTAFGLFVIVTATQAQSFIPAAGGTAAGSGGTLSYTIGQVAYTTISGINGNLTQGIQLPYEISVLTTIKSTSGIILDLSLYPNPASSFVILKVESNYSDNLTYHLFDMGGKLIQKSKIEGNETRIQLGDFRTGAYLLKITDGNKEIKTFRIIKN